jgi:hypothetical protein
MTEPVVRVALDTVDLTIGTAARLYRLTLRAAGATWVVAGPPARVALRAGRGAARRLPGRPDRALRDDGRALRNAGRAMRDTAQDAGRSEFDVLVPALVAAVLDRLDLTQLVIERVDLDRVARELDIDAVLDRMDLTEVVVQRVDLDRVASELDIDAVLDRMDLTEVVVRRVDLDRVASGLDVDAVVARADLEAAINRVDLIALAEFVVDGIDLPKIIRESSGTVASEGLRQVRLTSFEADRALAQFVDRLMLRRNARRDGHVPLGEPGVDGPGA